MRNLDIPFLQKVNDSVIVTSEYADIIIPSFYFEPPNLAEIQGQYVESFGFLILRYKEQSYQIKIPSSFKFGFSEILPDEKDKKGGTLKVFRQLEGGVIIKSLLLIQNGQNVMSTFKLLMSGKVTNIAYDDMVKMLFESSNLNKVNIGITSTLLEAIVSELGRYKDDYSIPFRNRINNKGTMDDLEFLPLKELPRTLSVFSGIAFEDINYSVQTGLVKTLNNDEQELSPIEKVIRL